MAGHFTASLLLPHRKVGAIKTFVFVWFKIERIKCIILHYCIMTEKIRNKKDDNTSNKKSNEMPSLKDYRSKEE